MATHSSAFAWKIPWTEEPGKLQSMGSQRVGHDFTFTFSTLKLEWSACSLIAYRVRMKLLIATYKVWPGLPSFLSCSSNSLLLVPWVCYCHFHLWTLACGFLSSISSLTLFTFPQILGPNACSPISVQIFLGILLFFTTPIR